MTTASTEPETAKPTRRLLGVELLTVLGLSLGASGIGALISFTGSLTETLKLGQQVATLNASRAPGRPWLDLAWQLYYIGRGLMPVVLVGYLLVREGVSLRVLGFDLGQKLRDLGRGAAVAAAIGGSGLALYLGSQAAGYNLTVAPSGLPDVWWRIPVLVASAWQNAILEEVVVLGYLLRRLGQLGWSWPAAVVASSVLRGSYHLYQGVGGLVGNMVMGAVFCLLYRRWGRVMPLVVAHALIDTVAFVGYALLAGHVSWLPTG
ncbi:CPBP family intramembrane glutamic endopeptidase [Streptomyces sp. CB01881]|uniref:CPBP family intramembrane glutamic endopeptidase n=1 Tax=Streptomyces sp. CB01881 TaxID=2078691 RepID=UPI000CDC57D9|nr:CPBP family intramembrane glutamic endopeptidase [Streptomyces sp. CB01881]AUY48624.1 CPBP family intramembrane metalloprotease domain-containing protein [Streptomyces sp. CB01881]TYC77118.1 CPBP family intramembrane metalloprotease [Streptomyces sp. CB01881]